MNAKWVLVSIVALGFILRAFCIFHHLPDFPQIEENLVLGSISNLKPSDLNPHDFIYPGLFYYLLLPLVSACKLFLSYLSINLVSPDIIIGRCVILTLSIFHIIIVYIIGKRLFDYRLGLIAALFLALNPLHASLSYIAKPDMLMSLLISMAFLFAYKLYDKKTPESCDYIMAGLFAGLAAAAKYNGLLGIMPLLVSHFLKSNGKSPFIGKNLFLALFSLGLVFFLANPFIILDFQHFIKDITGELNVYLYGFFRNPWANRQGWINYPLALNSVLGAGIFILSIPALSLAIYRHSKKDILILSFPVVYYIIMGASKNSPAWYLLPIVPFILLLAARFLIILGDKVHRIMPFKKIRYITIPLLCLIFGLPSLHDIARYNRWVTQKDTRVAAREWILNNISPGERILMDGVSGDIPFIFGKKRAHYNIDIIDWEKEIDYQSFFKENRFDFIIIDSDLRNKPNSVIPLYDFINDKFAIIREFMPSIDKPRSPFIYNPLYHPYIKIYNGNANVNMKFL